MIQRRSHQSNIARLAALALLFALLSFLAPRGAAAQSQPLIVATKPLVPFVFLEGGAPSGYSVDLWDEVARRLGVDYEWATYETVGEILDAVVDGEADVAIAGISMTRERESRLDFTHPFFDAGLQIMVPAAPSLAVQEVVRQFVSPAVIGFGLLALAAAFLMANFIYFAERRHNPDFAGGYLRGLWEALWWLLTIVANGEYPDKPTVSTRRRLMTIGFWLIGLLLVAQFTATVTSALTVQRLDSRIQGPEDLPGKRVVTVEGSTAADYLTGQQIAFSPVGDIDQAYDLLASGAADAIVYDAPVLQYYSVAAGRGSVAVVGSIFKLEKYGIALPQGSELREPINEVLLEMYQDGTLQRIYDRWFGS